MVKLPMLTRWTLGTMLLMMVLVPTWAQDDDIPPTRESVITLEKRESVIKLSIEKATTVPTVAPTNIPMPTATATPVPIDIPDELEGLDANLILSQHADGSYQVDASLDADQLKGMIAPFLPIAGFDPDDVDVFIDPEGIIVRLNANYILRLGGAIVDGNLEANIAEIWIQGQSVPTQGYELDEWLINNILTGEVARLLNPQNAYAYTLTDLAFDTDEAMLTARIFDLES